MKGETRVRLREGRSWQGRSDHVCQFLLRLAVVAACVIVGVVIDRVLWRSDPEGKAERRTLAAAIIEVYGGNARIDDLLAVRDADDATLHRKIRAVLDGK